MSTYKKSFIASCSFDVSCETKSRTALNLCKFIENSKKFYETLDRVSRRKFKISHEVAATLYSQLQFSKSKL